MAAFTYSTQGTAEKKTAARLEKLRKEKPKQQAETSPKRANGAGTRPRGGTAPTTTQEAQGYYVATGRDSAATGRSSPAILCTAPN